ncbi:glutathione S-transferase [Legionella israelensis]|uniref:Glutathione S-transferase n=1 Tax=Legionella israelensis TaxID=454 RepID=A0AAX1EGX4_9GAMM|nr:glutathione S-transferase N-terminal domain-containing protein [Legionella israelensis]QBR84331.1 glutathione S-transferase [Legionella israelensis]
MYTLYSFGTPNGFKPTIMLEELQVPYKIKIVDITQGEQFNPEFLKISPNNKIPAMHDDENDLNLFESVAILQYLAEKHQQFLPQNLKSKFTVLQWCYFQVGHIGPMFGQYGHFHRYADEDIPYAKKRYADECERLMSVMEKQLFNHQFISGSAYTIADMAIWPWLHCYQHFYESKIDEGKFPHLMQWYKKLEQRKAIQTAIDAYEEK